MSRAAAVILCVLPLAAQPRDLAGWLSAIEAGDRSIFTSNVRPPANLVPELRARLAKLKDPARVVAAQALERVATPAAGSLLLTMVTDANPSVASAASRALKNAKYPPPAEGILKVLPTVQSPPVRAHLYLAAGNAGASLAALRRVVVSETDPSAKLAFLAVAIRLGGSPERIAFAHAIRTSRADQVMSLMELILYTKDKRIARSLADWFDSAEPVTQISSDSQVRMARRSDVAVWIAHELGLVSDSRITSLANFDAATTAAAKLACSEAK